MPPMKSVISIDALQSSILREVRPRPPETAEVFLDRSVIEVFVNGRQCVAMRVYPGRQDSLGVSLRAQGREAVLNFLDAWQMENIYD